MHDFHLSSPLAVSTNTRRALYIYTNLHVYYDCHYDTAKMIILMMMLPNEKLRTFALEENKLSNIVVFIFYTTTTTTTFMTFSTTNTTTFSPPSLSQYNLYKVYIMIYI